MLPDEFSVTVSEEKISDIKPMFEETHDCLRSIVSGHDFYLFFKRKKRTEQTEVDSEDFEEVSDGKYYCPECDGNHFYSSQIGIDHFKYR